MSRPCVMTIGNFDGVHRGHRAILRAARGLADEHGAAVKAVTFDPHPATVLRPGRVPPRLAPAPLKMHLLRGGGADEVVVLAPTAALLTMPPRDFIEQLAGAHRPLAFVEGHDFRYGKDRAGDLASLERLGEELGFAVHAVAAVEAALCDHLIAPVRSSLIRWLVAQGRVADARLCLGRAFELGGRVVEGQRRGRTIGVPTANVATDPALAVPADAVYAGVAHLDDDASHPAAISIGSKPTFDGRRRAIEAHLLDFDGDLYGRELRITFTRWLRDQQTFPDCDALVAQLRRDIDAVRRFHASSGAP